MDIPRVPVSKTRRRAAVAAVAGVVVGLLLLATIALGRLKASVPDVQRADLYIDAVRRGQMLRQVRGPGTLLPEQIRWISAVTSGRVERVNLRPGAQVHAGTELLVLSNPDVQLEALAAEQQAAAAEAALVSLRTTLESQRLNQEGAVATVRSQLREAERNLAAAEALAQRNLGAQNELARARDQVEEFTTRLRVEDSRLTILAQSADSQVALQRGQVERIRAIAAFHRSRVASMHVMAGADGVVQDLTLEIGQWVPSGTTLARVLQPSKLKAVVRVPETLARDVALGQSASVDTRLGVVRGRVMRIDPASQNGSVAVDVALEGPLPQGARPDLAVDGTIEIDRLNDVLFVGRPASGQEDTTVTLFKLVDGGRYAERVSVRLGRASVTTVEILAGLRQGDRVILSDMTQWGEYQRVRLR